MIKHINKIINDFNKYDIGNLSNSVIISSLSWLNDNMDSIADLKEFHSIKEKLLPYLARSRFINLAYNKPRGYAGDYTMMQHIYNDIPIGEGKLGTLIDKWCLGRRGAQAVFNRKKMFQNIIDELPSRSSVLGVACGAATELAESSNNIYYTGLDMDAGALQAARLHADMASGEITFNAINENIIRWSLKTDTEKKYDLIYSAGLIDYFNYGCVRALLDRCFSLLNKGGKMIVGNFSPYEDMSFMTHILEWKLIYRTVDELSEIVLSSKFGNMFSIMHGDDGVNIFAVCER